MVEQITKNQHYVPQSLLWYFTNPNKKLFEVLLREKKIYPTNTNNSMCETFTYEHEKLPVNTIEKYLSKIEGDVATQVKDLIQVIEEIKEGKNDISNAKVIVEETLHNFLLFYYRSGALLTEYSSFKKEDKIPLMSDKILNHEYLYKLAEVIKDFYNFAIIESSGDFLISDQFISTSALKIKTQFFDISNRHIGLNETLILIPVSSSYYIAYWNTKRDFFLKKNSINILNEEGIKKINNTIINNSYIKCAGMKKEKIEEVLPEFKESSPTQIFAGGNPKNFSMGAIKKKEVFFDEEEKEVWELFKFHTSMNYKNLDIYDLCKCGSGKKFKWCHFNLYKRVEEIWSTFRISKREGIMKFYIWGVPIIEQTKKNVQGLLWGSDPIQEEYAKALTEALPKELNACIKETSGTESIEVAIKVARVYTERKRIIGFNSHYHGQLFASLAIGYPKDSHQKLEPLVPEIEPIPFPHNKITEEDFNKFLINFEELLSKKDIAAVITEPGIITGWGSTLIAYPGFLTKLREITLKYGTLLIVDEVGTGFSRTGKLFGIQHENVTPDMIIFAKGMSNGASAIGAVVGKSEIFKKAFLEAMLISTFGWTPIACAVSLKTLQIHLRDKTWEMAESKGNYIKEKLKSHIGEIVVDVRGMGLEIGLQFKDAETCKRIQKKCFADGLHVIVGSGDNMQIMPPLTIPQELLDEGLDILIKNLL